jgi:CPA1 family monovalent cation:H+ antiporter
MTVAVYLLLLAIAVGWLSNRVRIPYPILLVLAGIAIGFLPQARSIAVPPELLLAVVLPAALYPAALDTSWRDFRRNLRPILLLAVGFVVATTLGVGAAFKALVPSVPWSLAFTFGAIVSPPDAVAATTILRRFRLPKRILTILEGESLVNDASGLVLYRFALAALLTGSFSAGSLAAQFAIIAIGGVVIGIAVGWLTARIQERLHDPMLEITMSLTTPFLTYVACEAAHASGVLGVVAVGLFRARWGHKGSTPEARLNTRVVWYTILFLANCFVFAYMGLVLPQTLGSLVGGASPFHWGELLRLGVLLSLIVIAIRFIWVFPATYLPRWLSPSLRKRDPPPPVRSVMLISYCGMRGIVSLAIALALPETLPDGAPFVLRGLIIFLTFCVILTTLVGQGLTLPAFLRLLRMQVDRGGDGEEPMARERMRHAAFRQIDRLVEEEDASAYVAIGIKRALAAESTHTHGADGDSEHLSSEASLWIHVIDAQRAELLKLWEEEKIGDEVLRHLERELDLVATRVVHRQA